MCGYISGWLSSEVNSTFRIHQIFTNYYPQQMSYTTLSKTINNLTTTEPTIPAINCTKLLNSSNKKVRIISKEIQWYNETQCQNVTQPTCGPKNLVGRLAVDFDPIDMDELKATEASFVEIGGWLAPKDCKVKAHTAFIIPFRDREKHLPILLHQILPIFERRNQHFRIFVIEQSNKYTFNRGKLMNVGYREALRYFPYTCFVFHDVDLIPENDNIEFSCEHSPAHLSVAIDKHKYKLLYKQLFGGAGMLTKEHFEKINGFSNSFWSWGGEDDNLYQRVERNGLKLKRQSVDIARYKMIKHQKSSFIEPWRKRMKFWKRSLDYIHEDGLNNLQYKVLSRHDKLLYTHIVVDLRKNLDLELGIRKYRKPAYRHGN